MKATICFDHMIGLGASVNSKIKQWIGGTPANHVIKQNGDLIAKLLYLQENL